MSFKVNHRSKLPIQADKGVYIVQPVPQPLLRRVDSIQIIKENGSNQKLRLFNLGKTISGDPS